MSTKRRMSRRDFVRASAIAGASLLATRCAPPTAAPVPAVPATTAPAAAAAPTAAPVQAAPAVKGGGTLVFGYAQRTESNLCATATWGGSSDVYLRRFAHAGLVQVNSSLTGVIPELAEKWEFSGNKCTFHLAKGLKWQDGEPFTAKDVLFTFHVVAHPKSPGTNYVYPSIKGLVAGMDDFKAGKADKISGITADDDYTVTFEMPKPYRNTFLMGIAVATIIPEHVLKSVPEDQYGGSGSQTGICQTDWGLKTGMGLGPFMVSNYIPSEVVEYDPFSGYVRGQPKLGKLIYRPFTDEQALAAAIEKGEVHVGRVPPSEFARFEKMSHLRFNKSDSTANMGWAVNVRRPFLNDKRFRQALMYAQDRQKFLENVYYGLGKVAEAPFLYGDAGVSANIHKYPYDQQKAKDLLKEVGWDSSKKLTMIWDEMAPQFEPWFSFMIAGWKDVGVDVELKLLGAEYMKVFAETFDWDIEPTSFGYGVNVVDASIWFDSDTSGYKNADGLALIEQAATAEGDAFNQAVWKLQELAAEELPIAYQVNLAQAFAINKAVNAGPDFKPVYALWTRNYWGLEQVTVAGS